MDICPKSRRHGTHNWRGERFTGTWFLMICTDCGQLVLDDVSGKDRHGTQR